MPEKLLGSTAWMALGRPGDAEQLARALAIRPSAPPELALVYGRAVEVADDLSAAVRGERARDAYARVCEAWPGGWEATIAHAVLAGRRRSAEESGFETLRDLSALRRGVFPASSALVDVFDALTSARQQMLNRARTALERARPSLAGTALFEDAEEAMGAQIGADHTASACATGRKSAQDTLSCFEALRASGRHEAATGELERLRKVVGAPLRYLPLELRERLLVEPRGGTESPACVRFNASVRTIRHGLRDAGRPGVHRRRDASRLGETARCDGLTCAPPSGGRRRPYKGVRRHR